MTDTLGQLPWMTAPATTAVFDALEAAGGPDCARFVGGCVRNAVIGQPIADIDVATSLTPQAVIKALKAGGVRAVSTGVEHGTVTAVFQHHPLEVTTLRRDVETDGRRAVVAFTTDWREDAERRDFTLNSLYASRDGKIFDPTGHGVADARAGRIVFVGDPEMRLREDHLRSLRFFRFLAWYGRGEPDAAAIAAITALKDQVASLAAERISTELLKLLAATDPRLAVRLMQQTGVLSVILPGPLDLARFEALVGLELARSETQPLLRLAALLPDAADEGARTAARLRLSNAERDRLAAALQPAPELAAGLAPHAAHAAIYRLGGQAFVDRVKLNWAAAGADEADGWRDLLAIGRDWTPPVLPVSGADVLAAGAPKGPKVGETLRALEAWWIDGDFAANRDAALVKLQELVA
ncbi:CCA tRNA nucleotidyltransferase [Phenylobacterium sp. LjRoot219]|uniref:CCA tRNA nucleotidyltransferase n=1 Tax=Phenylobacterium sp. LjRoot219 TaxID=3342283 RepID=UPI003ECE974F